MAETTGISWCDSTFNPWEGCTKVAPECANCYAEARAVRWKSVVWGPNGTRRVAAESKWREPLKWNRDAKAAGERRRVFCASLADVFEDWQGPMLNAKGERLCVGPHDEWLGMNAEMQAKESAGSVHQTESHWLTMQDVRYRLFSLIDATPNLDWLILTKRPENVKRLWPFGWYGDQFTWPNFWLGTSIGNQERADSEIPKLLAIPAAVRFLSVEPQLGPIDLSKWMRYSCRHCKATMTNKPPGYGDSTATISTPDKPAATWGWSCSGSHFDWSPPGIHWVIQGGESGHGSRPFDPAWARSLRDQCKAAGVAYFLKQMGANIVTRNDMVEDGFNDREGFPDPQVEHNIHGFREDYQGADCRIKLIDKKGGDPQEWPIDLRDCREFPKPRTT